MLIGRHSGWLDLAGVHVSALAVCPPRPVGGQRGSKQGTTATATMVILDSTTTEVYNSTTAGSFALAAGAYDLTMTESSPTTDTFASNQATVTVTDQDGTATPRPST